MDRTIPSLMFLLRENRNQNAFSFLRKFIRNLLFFVQILVLIVLAFSLAQPYVNLKMGVKPGHTVLIIDGSASSQTKYEGTTRFDKEISEAKNYVSQKTSIILAAEYPIVVLDKGTKGSALAALSSMHPTDTKTNLEAAIAQADAILGTEKGLIVVISDFIISEDTDQITKAMRILTSKGNKMQFIEVNNEAKNIGIIDLDITKYNFNVYIKNFEAEEKTVIIRQVQDNKVYKEYEKLIEPNYTETITFDTLPGSSRVELAETDDFAVDNTVYMSAPLHNKIKLLLITSLKAEELNTDFFVKALTASNEFSLSISRPPRTFVTLDNLEVSKLDPDVIITYKINKDELLPYDFNTIATMIQNGKSLVITVQDQLGQIDFAGLLPITVTGVGQDTDICINIINEFTKRFEQNKCFTESKKYLAAEALNNSVVVATTNTKLTSPIMVLNENNKGKIFYYGIFDNSSDFKVTEEYPIFWNSLINYLVQSENIQDYTKRLGDEGFNNETKAGYYQINGKTVALNLLDETESNVNTKSKFMQEKEGFYIKPDPEKQPYYIEIPLMIIAILLLLFELVYLKIQGDL